MTNTDTIVQGQNVNTVEVAPVEPQQPQSIPYSRFAEVVAQKNEYAQRLAAIQQPQQPAAVNADPYANINDIQGLVNAVKQETLKEVQSQYQREVLPIKQQLESQAFNGVVENYFSSPEKAQLRQDMDNYTASLPENEKQFLKQAILQGRTQYLDHIYYTIANQKQMQMQQMASQNANQNSAAAQTPQQYRTAVMPQQTLHDKIGNAQQSGNWSSVFDSLVPRE